MKAHALHEESQTWWPDGVWAHLMLGGQERWVMGRSMDVAAPDQSNIVVGAKVLSQDELVQVREGSQCE